MTTLSHHSCCSLYAEAKQGNEEARDMLTDRWGGKYPKSMAEAEACKCCGGSLMQLLSNELRK